MNRKTFLQLLLGLPFLKFKEAPKAKEIKLKEIKCMLCGQSGHEAKVAKLVPKYNYDDFFTHNDSFTLYCENAPISPDTYKVIN